MEYEISCLNQDLDHYVIPQCLQRQYEAECSEVTSGEAKMY